MRATAMNRHPVTATAHSPAPLAPLKPSVQVLERMFQLFEVLAAHEEPVPLKQISESTGLHPSTAHRLLNDLALGRFVERPEPGAYRLGMRLLELGNLVKARLSVREAAVLPMRELHKEIRQPVNLSVRQGDEIVYIERAYSERSGMQVVRAIGGRAPLHLTSVGKLFLASDDAQRLRAYASRTGLMGQTRNSNMLVREGQWHINLQKTGFIREAGRTLVLQADVAGRSLIMVLLGATGSQARADDADRLLRWVMVSLFSSGPMPAAAAVVGRSGQS